MKATFTVEIEPLMECTPQEFKEWVMHELRVTKSISPRNPLNYASLSIRWAKISNIKFVK